MENKPHSQQLTIQQAISLAKKATKKGKIADAAELYTAVLAQQPNHQIAQKKLRELQQELPKNQSTKEEPSNPPQNQITALVNLYRSGQLKKSEQTCKDLLQIYPQSLIVMNVLGAALSGQGKFKEAVESYDKIIQLKPDYADAYNNRGNVLKDLGKAGEALESYDQAIRLKPDYAEAYNNRGNVLKDLGKAGEALESYDRAIQLKPDYAEAYNNHGAALQDLGRLEEAAKSYDQAIQLKPDYAMALYNQGNVAQQLGQPDEALECYDKAIQLRPDHPTSYSNRGVALNQLGQLSEALKSFNKAIQLKPNHAEAYSNRGVALKDLGLLDEAFTSYDKAIQLKPDYEDAYSNLLMSLNYNPDLNVIDYLATARKFGELVTEKTQTLSPDYQCLPVPKKLRVGFVSGDLRNHPIGYFLESILSSIDPSTIELIAYTTTPTVDDLSERIQPFFSMWKPIYGQTDEAAATLIHADGIHVLLDLSGHTAGNRLPMFGYKPSPVQASWLGYFATTGLNEMDYLIGDPYVTPPKDDDQFTEKVWRLPETRWCFTPPNTDVGVSVPPALNNGYVTFGCFNNATKVNDKVVELWAKVLDAIPNSRLLFKAKQFDDQLVRESTIQRFAAQGVNSNRISLEGQEDRQKYFEAYNKIDITLDPFPFTGGTTSVESLWMGVPLVTLAGHSLVARQGVGVLMNAGLSDWIAENGEEYVAKVVLFASDLDKLASLRAGLRSQVLASPLFDAPRFARNIENALWEMWNQWDPLDHPPATKRSSELQKEETSNPPQNQITALVDLYRSGQLKKTEQACRDLLQIYPQSLVVMNVLGAALTGQGKLKESIQVNDKSIQLKPDFAEAYNNRGNALRALGQLDEAVKSYDKAVQLKPDYAEAYNNKGVALEKLEQFDKAVQSYDKAILLKSDYAWAYNNKGVALEQLEQFDKAMQSYDQAIQLKPDFVEAYSNRGNALKELGQLEEALKSYDKAIQLSPDFVEAYYNKGVALEQLEQFDKAVQNYDRAIQLKPDYAEAYYNRGVALKDLGLRDKAIENYDRAIQLKPDYAEAYNNRGIALRDLGRVDEAMQNFDRAIQLRPDYPEAFNNRGAALQDLGRLEEAMQNFDRTIQLKPDYAEVYSNRGNALQDLGRLDEAIQNFDRTIQLKPDFSDAYNNRGNALRELRQLEEALKSYNKAIQLKPNHAEAYSNRGVALQDLGLLDEAFTSYDKAIQLKPDYEEAYSNLLMTLNYNPNFNAIEHIDLARKFGELVTKKTQTLSPDYQCLPVPKKLRVGFVSGDLRNHPIGYFLESILSSIDPSTIELIAYPTRPKVDDLSERIQPFFSMWKPIYGQTDEAAATLIHADGIHVLLDLSGHTAGNRLPMFGYKPSPVQASWLGYFATTGLNEMDYLIGDPYVTPPKDDDQFTEKVWRLPETRWCFTPPNTDVGVSVPPALNNGYVTFGCFNNATKVNDKVVELWAKVLDAIPNSRLLFKAKQFDDQLVRESTIQRFAAQGVNSNRISLEGQEDRQKYFEAYNKIDITLDPFPFTGGTTSVESLWMGVPLVTLAGHSLVARQGVGVLMNAGLSDWIAENGEEYVAKVVLFASDLDKLASLRAGLRSQVLASPLFDAPRFARNIENALWEMWNQWDPLDHPPATKG